MIQHIVEFCIRFRILVVAAAVALIFFGSAHLRQMPVDILPEFSPPTVEIQTEALGLSAAEVETMVSLGVEELMAGLPWLKRMQSESVAGLSSIRLEFEPNTPLMRARQLVQERLTTAFLLPNVAKPPIMQQPTSSTNRVMMVALSSRTLSPIALSVLTQWTIKPKLLGIPGVAKVAIWGERRRQLQVQVDPEALLKNKLTLRQVISSTGDSLWVSHLSFLKSSVPGTGGFLDTPSQRMEIRHILPVSSAADLAKIGIDGTNLKLGDVANVVEGHPPLIGDAVVADGQGLLLVIEKFPGVNTLEVTRAVERALDDLRPGLGGVKIDSHAFRPASFVEWSLRNTGKVMGAGALIAVLAMAAFLLNWRALAIGLLAIPVALVSAALVLDALGVTANAMVLAGFAAALASMIDDLVVAAAAHRRRLTGAMTSPVPVGGLAIGSIIRDAAIECRRPILFATLVSLLAVLPVFFIEGQSGTFLGPLVLSYATAIVVSLLVTLTVVPAMAAILGGRPRTHGNPGAHGAPFQAAVARASRATPGQSMVSVAVLLQLAVIAVVITTIVLRSPASTIGFLPRFDERDMVIHWEAQPGISRDEMFRITSRAAGELRNIDGVKAVNAHIGRAISGDQTVGINSGRIWLRIDPQANYAAVLAEADARLRGYKDMVHKIHSYLNDRLGTTLTHQDASFTVRLYGQHRSELATLANTVKNSLLKVDGLWDVRINSVPMEPQVQVEVDLAKAAQAGIKPGDVRRAASTLFAGLEVGQIFESQKVFEVVVWSKPESRRNLDSIKNALIELPKGQHIRLADVADVKVLPTPSVIHREQISQYVDIVASTRGRGIEAITADVEDRLRGIHFKLGYHPKIVGVAANPMGIDTRVIVAACTALAGILLLMQSAFGSWRLALAVLATLPLVLFGGVTSAFIIQHQLSLGTIAGLFAVFAITMRYTMSLVVHILDLAGNKGEPPRAEHIAAALADRAPSIVVSALALVLALIPAIYFTDSPGLELLSPMAVAIVGGLLTSVLYVLFVVPMLVARLGASREADLALELA